MVARRKFARNRNRPKTKCDRRITGKPGIRIKNLVAGFEQSHHGKKQRSFAAGCNHYVDGRNFDIARALQIGGNRLAERGNPHNSAVAVFALGKRFDGGLDDSRAWMKIRLPQFEMNDGTALAFQFLGASVDRKRALSAHDRHPGCYGSHAISETYNPLYMPPSTSNVWPVT